MKLEGVDIDKTLAELETALIKEPYLSDAMKLMIQTLMMVVKLLANQVGLKSHNSSKPPSTDPNRKKTTRQKSTKKTGGQKGHTGTTLKQITEPDEIEVLLVNKTKLPKGNYHEVGFEKRQVFDIYLAREVTEFQAQILENEKGQRFVADFPNGVNKAVQYGKKLKAHCVYLSQYQLLPYKRIQAYFTDQLHIPLSQGSIFNFNQTAYHQLADFEQQVKEKLRKSTLLHADETGVNIGGKRHWLHCQSNASWTYFCTHKKRGSEAIDEMSIIPHFTGTLVHDHWKPYYRYTNCLHALCNAHHIRELVSACEQDNQVWAGKMKAFLEELNDIVHTSDGVISPEEGKQYRHDYHEILKEAERECPAPDPPPKAKKKRGRLKRSKSRNLLERFMNYEEDILRFMENKEVPFTNNQGENDIRMTKVQQKISGCFRSMEGAGIFARIRGYLSTCRKQGVKSSEAMVLLFDSQLPDFL